MQGDPAATLPDLPVERIADDLVRAVQNAGVEVKLALPGPIETEIWDLPDNDAPLYHGPLEPPETDPNAVVLPAIRLLLFEEKAKEGRLAGLSRRMDDEIELTCDESRDLGQTPLGRQHVMVGGVAGSCGVEKFHGPIVSWRGHSIRVGIGPGPGG